MYLAMAKTVWTTVIGHVRWQKKKTVFGQFWGIKSIGDGEKNSFDNF
jgi:hypothetical protein